MNVAHVTVATPLRLAQLQRYWRTANYLGAAQLYLRDNVFLKDPLRAEHVKPRPLGHWGTQPGLNLIYAHLNRLIQDTDASILMVVGPGHGAPAILANLYLEGSLEAFYPDLTLDEEGAHRLIRRFSWPGGFPSHVGPMTPGAIHEGGELGHSLAHAFGAVFDNPELIAACIVGDGEAETGPLAAAWQSNKFLNPATSGAVLPMLHLNGYKLSGPTVFARMSGLELHQYFCGLGYELRIVSDRSVDSIHTKLWSAMDWAYTEIRAIQRAARDGRLATPSVWPLIVLDTPKGWTGPVQLDGHRVEGTYHAHGLPISDPAHNPEHLSALESWLRSYRPNELFDAAGRPAADVLALCPNGHLRMGMNSHANDAATEAPLRLPDVRAHAVAVSEPGTLSVESTHVLGGYLRETFRRNEDDSNFRLFCPDETISNRLDSVFEATSRAFVARIDEGDEYLSRNGRVMEMLSEHVCEGWLEGYVLTGRHGIFACYEAFATIVDSMIAQHAKWLKASADVPWRRSIPSLNLLLTSHAWRQDHNGYSHQGPGFIDVLVSKKSSTARVYLPPDANSLLAVTDNCLRTSNRINLIIASKNHAPQWLDFEDAVLHCRAGASVWDWASTDHGVKPDIVLAAAGDVPTLETMAAASLLAQYAPDLRVRVVNVVDLFSLEKLEQHPHGLDDDSFEALFTNDTNVVFAFHGYPRVIHELIYRRPNPQRFHVRGYIEEGTTTTPFDMVVRNLASRYHIAIEALRRAQLLTKQSAQAIDTFCDRLASHRSYIIERGTDMPDVTDWRWSKPGTARG